MRLMIPMLISCVLFSANMLLAETKDNPAKKTEKPSLEKKKSEKEPSGTKEKKNKGKNKEVALFDGKTLKNWKKTNFGGEGEVKVKNGELILEFGNDLTGVTYTGKLPKIDYEVNLEAKRIDGSDFFCGLTFPVNDNYASLIVGGWGGGVCGISCIDTLDASENDTTTFREFKKGTWYKIRLKVTKEKIEAWIDGKQIVDQQIKDKKINVRIEVEPSRPFGIASYQTTAALKNIKVKSLQPNKKKSKKETKKNETKIQK